MATTYNNLYLDIRQQLRRAGIEEATLEARELVCFGTNKSREELARDGGLYASPELEHRVRDLVRRHLEGEPVAYLIGEWEFYGLPLDISRDVLIPRPDTEVLAEQAIGYIKTLGECRVLDLCAAPGGKSLTIAEQMQNRGELFSGEAMTGRVKLLKQAFDRCGIERAKPYHGDATILNPAFGLGSFDRVLCDVPCSGLGVIGKKPDIREKTLDGIENLLLTQQKILQNGAKYLAPNGRLVYSTCTVNHHENEAQVRQFLQDNQDFSVIAPQIILSGMRVGEYGTLFLPHETSTDGFFAAILERQKNC